MTLSIKSNMKFLQKHFYQELNYTLAIETFATYYVFA